MATTIGPRGYQFGRTESPPRDEVRFGMVLRKGTFDVSHASQGIAPGVPMNRETRKKVLLLSYSNNPDAVSVALEAYREYAQLRKHFDTILVTHARNASALRKSGIPDSEVVYINVPVLDWLHNLFLDKVLNHNYGSMKLTAFLIPFYIVYEFVIWSRLRSEIKAGRFALVHRLDPVSPVLASPFSWLMRNLKTPFSLGPINGGLPWPSGYGSASRERERIRFLRWLYTYLPFSRSTYTKSKAVIVGSSYTYLAAGRRVERDRLFFIQQNGIPERDIVEDRRYDDLSPVRVCFLGRLVPLKNCNIVIRSAAALIREKKIQLDIVGDGWDRSSLEALTRDLGLEKDVTFHGWLPHPQAMEILARSHIMALPSIREFGGGVVVEAMARGVVPIVVRYGGPSDLVEEGYGISLALKNEPDTIRDLERVLGELVKSPDRIRQLGDAARVKARSTFTWEKKTELLAAVMTHAMGAGPRPALVPNRKLLSQYDAVTIQ
jgi:glycosyltransferase involved in cell wall biosynthesis